MYTIIRERDSGKARELLEIAQRERATVATEDVARLREKANAYGIYDVDICSYEDLLAADPEREAIPVLIHNLDKFIVGRKIIGFSATREEKQ